MKIKLAMLIIIMCFSSGYGVTSNKNIPFYPGEKMTFRVMWAFVVAGKVTIEFLPYEKFEDIDSCHFLFTARTSKFVDIFYRVRDRIESYTDIDLAHALFYYKFHKGLPLHQL